MNALTVDRGAYPYRMKDLCERTGLPRQVLHFYMQQGLLPEGHKTGRNMAYYGDEHVERVLLIRRLQHERFLPLKAIRAMLEERDEVFSPAQRALLKDVKARLANTREFSGEAVRETVPVDEVLAKTALDRDDFDKMVEMGLLGVSADAQGRAVIARDDAWMVETFGSLRAQGFTKDLGFTAADLQFLEEGMSALFHKETELLASRLAHLPPERVAAMVVTAIPLINTFLAKYHETKVRNFFAAL